MTPTDFTRPEQVFEVNEALERHQVHYVLCHTTFDYEPIFFSLPPSVDHLGPLLAYLRAHYHVVKSFEDSDQVWERNPEPQREIPSGSTLPPARQGISLRGLPEHVR